MKIKFISCLILVLIAFLSYNFANKKKSKPNVVVILVDDLGWTDLSSFGSDFYQTPHVDELASDGVKFTNSYSTCTVCSPTRASIMTGKYPANLNLTDWIQGHKFPWAKLSVPDWTMYLKPEEYTMAEAFKDAGYFTAHVGKWHLGDEEKDWPENHGFDVNIGGWLKGAPNKVDGEGYFSPYANPRLQDGPEGEYLTERLTKEVCTLIEEKKDQPFFINFWLYNVHMPLQAKQDKIDKYEKLLDADKRHKNAVYAAMVEHMDEAVGQVIAKLKEQGLYENTIILFSSDNGGLIGRNNRITDNTPLRHGKGGMYEGGVRVPTILYSPLHDLGTSESDKVVTSTDYYPTLAELAGIKIPVKHKQEMDGDSWISTLSEKRKGDQEPVYWHYPHYHQEGAVPYSAIRDGDWKLIENFETNTVELYNLRNDLGEKENLADSNTDKVNELLSKLEAWRAKVGAQYATENALYDKARERKKRRK